MQLKGRPGASLTHVNRREMQERLRGSVISFVASGFGLENWQVFRMQFFAKT